MLSRAPRTKAASRAQPGTTVARRTYVSKPGPAMKVINPANGELVAELPTDRPAAISRKFDECKQGLKQLATIPLDTRKKYMTKFNDLLTKNADELAKTLTLEMGKPITQSHNEIRGVKDRVTYFIDHVDEALAEKVVYKEGQWVEKITREPLGVIANISAWNYPYNVGLNVIVPALLTGNTILYKPSEFATMTGLKIEQLIKEAGFPSSVMQTVVGGQFTGQSLMNQQFQAVFFTGSYNTGKKIYKKAAAKMIKTQLELGGKDPIYVYDDVDIKAAVRSIADGAMYNAGQSCCAVERVYIHQNIYQEFCEEFVKEVKTYKVGDPMDKDTYLGPIAREGQLRILEAQVADAVRKGAKLALGGKRMNQKGFWFEPTVLTDCTHAMNLMRDESFGPVIGLMKMSGDEKELVRFFNDNEYGLTAGVFSKNQTVATNLLSQVNYGEAYWNCCDRVSPRMPWAGRGHSGVGLTLGIEGIQAFTHTKSWHLKNVYA